MPTTAPLAPQATARTRAYDRKLLHVLAAAARVMAREGYGRSTIRQVSREAGMSLAGLYHYFSSKEELLFLLQHHVFEAIVDALTRRLEGVGDPQERLRIVVANHLEHFLARMDELKVCVHEMESLRGEYSRRVQELRRRYFSITLEVVEAIGVEAGGSKASPRLATLYLFGMLNWIYMWYPPTGGISAAVLGEELVSLFLDGFLPRPPGDGGASADSLPGRAERSGRLVRAERGRSVANVPRKGRTDV